MPLPELTIGTATDRIDLLSQTGLCLEVWRPVAGDHAGTFTESAAADLRQLVMTREVTVHEKLDLNLKAKTQGDAISYLRELRQMLRNALDYWVDAHNQDPVYLAARAGDEEYTRYAVIHDARLGDDDNPFGQPFTGTVDASVGMEALTLVIERGPWLDQIPGLASCLEVASGKDYPGRHETSSTFVPTAQADDVAVNYTTLAFSTAATDLVVGLQTDHKGFGIRFRNVTIPNGATIIDAFIRFEATATDASSSARAFIYGDQDATPAAFTTFQDYVARTLTEAVVEWPPGGFNTIEGWTAGNSYDTPDIGVIVQEIVNLTGWLSGNDMTVIVKPDWPATQHRQAASWDHLTAVAPTLYVTYASTVDSRGTDATCTEKVYVANYDVLAQITHAYQATAAGAWSANRIIAGPPYNLFPVGALANGDVAVIGVGDYVDGGGFANVIFNLSVAATFAGTAYFDVEYWDGAAWQDWTDGEVWCDTTSSGEGVFSQTGIGSLVSSHLGFGLGTLNAMGLPAGAPVVSGYWIKVEAAGIGGGNTITGPVTQQTDDIYTANWSSLLVDGDDVEGDIEALVELAARTYVGCFKDVRNSGFGGYIQSIVVGTRCTDRGADFVARLNASRKGNLPGMEVVIGTDGYTSFVTTTGSYYGVTGEAVHYNPGGVLTAARRIVWELDERLSAQYYGTFHAYVTGLQVGSSVGEFPMRLIASIGITDTSMSPIVSPPYNGIGSIQIIDMGRITVAPTKSTAGQQVRFRLELGCNDASSPGDLYIYELCLIPVDEWASQYTVIDDGGFNASRLATSALSWDMELSMDGIDPRSPAKAELTRISTSNLQGIWRGRFPGPLVKPRKEQRVWFMFYQFWDPVATGEMPTIEPSLGITCLANKVQRFMSMRGSS